MEEFSDGLELKILKLMLSLFTSQSRVRLSERQKNLKAWESEILLVACLGFSDWHCTLGLTVTCDKMILFLQNSIAFVIKLNTRTQYYCKDFCIGS